MSVNVVMLLGRLGADPEVKTVGGEPVCNFSLATSEKWTGRDGQPQERTEWHRIQVWGKTAEHCGRFLAKGRECHVQGKIQSRKYTDKDGVERTAYEIRADRVTFVGGSGGGRDAGDGAPPPAAGSGGGGSGPGAAPARKPVSDEDLPF